jgi:Fe-Mn family superoxide dismutase
MMNYRGYSEAKDRHELARLPYPVDGLEPAIDKQVVETHYRQHHAKYVEKLNDKLAGEKTSLEAAYGRAETRFLAGQIVNHDFYWRCMTNNRFVIPSFGDSFAAAFVEASAACQDSGWLWLMFNRSSGRGEIELTKDGDTMVFDKARTPILVCDLWEHAYYLQYFADRATYVKAFLRVVDWQAANQRVQQAKS